MNRVGTHIDPVFRLDIGEIGEEDYGGDRREEIGDRQSREQVRDDELGSLLSIVSSEVLLGDSERLWRYIEEDHLIRKICDTRPDYPRATTDIDDYGLALSFRVKKICFCDFRNRSRSAGLRCFLSKMSRLRYHFARHDSN